MVTTWGRPPMAFGGDYNPEQWDESVWPEDIELMQRAGVNFVTVGVFSWATLQPRRDAFETGWLDRVLDLLHAGGIAVDLATATASPPPWLLHDHPEIAPVDWRGMRYSIGSRQTWCASSPVFRDHAVALVERLADRYGKHPAVAMWHVSNELGCHNARCYCATSTDAFRSWLTRRYEDLATLNEAWGTAFWSQAYSRWEEIQAPGRSTAFSNPTQLLDFARFSSDALLEHFVAERDVLHERSPGIPVTTNFILDQPNVDCFGWAPELDLVANDHYVLGHLPDPLAHLAFAADLTRGCAGGRPWLLMEHSTSAVNWQPVNRAKAPGEMARHSLAHVARGADGVAFFQWRASQAGSERFHSALLPHAGADTDRFREVAALGAMVGRLSEVVGSSVDADVAILWDWSSVWALDAPSMPSALVRAADAPRAAHRALRTLGVTCDVVHPGADLGRYRMIVVPTLYLCTDEHAVAVAAAAAAGAQVVVTYFSGIVDEQDHIRLGGYPGAFRDLVGVRVEEFFPLAAGATVALDDGRTASVWTERLTVADDVEVLARHTAAPLAGVPAITQRPVGTGAAWYVATALDDDGLRSLFADLVASAGVTAPVPVPTGAGEVDITRRVRGDESWLFVLHHGADEVWVDVTGHDLVADRAVTAPARVSAGECLVVREEGR